MDDFELEIKKEFINEALMNLEEAETSFVELENTSDTKPLLDKIFRLAHNLKGGSRAVGFGDVAEFTHHFENLVLSIQKGSVKLTSDVVTTLLRCNDRVAEMLNELKANIGASFENSDLLVEISGHIEGTAKSGGSPTTAATENAAQPAAVAPVKNNVVTLDGGKDEATHAPIESISAEGAGVPVPVADAFFPEEATAVESPKLVTEELPKEPPKQVSKPQPAKSKDEKPRDAEDEIIRVSMSKIDMLNDYVGELIVLQSMIQQQEVSKSSTVANSSMRQMVKLSKDIQSLSMGLRMLPVKPLVQKLQRVVRDTSLSLKKKVKLGIVGEHLDIDKSVLDRLADPLIHILRNAVDHGLESTSERLAANKPEEGEVTLMFYNEGNNLIVEVKDDGKGINAEILKTKAIEKGIISANQEYSEKQLINLIFHPGFSTKSETSEISGRGVGMDVVKTNVEKAGGHIDVSTSVGKGSLFKIQIPLTLAVTDGLVVMSGGGRYVVPLNQVQETLNLNGQRVFNDKLGIGRCVELRGSVVPLFSLRELMSKKKSESDTEKENTALIVVSRGQLMGLVIDEIVRSQQIVIKPFTNGIYAHKGWVGSCVLGDGLPTLILSPLDLLDGIVSQTPANSLKENVA